MQQMGKRADMKGIIVAVVALSILSIGALAQASNSRSECEVMTILASNAGQGIDSALVKFEDIFKKPPFADFNTFKLVNRQLVAIDSSQPRMLSLPDSIGGSLHIDRKKKGMLALTLTLNRAGKKPITIKGTAAPGSPLFAAGMKRGSGIWVFGVACKFSDQVIKY